MNDDSGGDVEFLDSFSGLHDPRQQAKVLLTTGTKFEVVNRGIWAR